MQIYPDDETIVDHAGFVVYGPRSVNNPAFFYVVGGPSPKKTPNNSGDLIAPESGDFLIQVYNDSQTAINFTIWADNLPAQPASAPIAAPPPAAAPVAAAPVVVPPTPQAGPSNLSANSYSARLAGGGKTALYEFTYPGDQSVYTIGLNLTPNDPQIAKNAGFNVFGPTRDKVYATGGYQGGLTPNMSGNVIALEPGTYTIQVYNYTTIPLDYTITLQPNPPPGEVLAGRTPTPG
jgi:hypothetical protein